MASNTHEFVKHVTTESGAFMTDVWLKCTKVGRGTYSSVLTDTIYGRVYDTLEDIEADIHKFYKGAKIEK